MRELERQGDNKEKKKDRMLLLKIMDMATSSLGY